MNNMIKFIIYLLVIFIGGQMSSHASNEFKSLDFEATLCKSRDMSASFVFVNKDHDDRHFAFSFADKILTVQHPDLSGLLDHKAIESIRLFQLDANKKYITLVLKESHGFFFNKVKELEFGVMEKKCSDLLIEKLGGDIPIEQVKQRVKR